LIRTKVGKKEENYELGKGSSLSELLNKLARIHGESLRNIFDVENENVLDPTFIVTINGITSEQLQGFDTILKDGDKIDLMTLISGG
jgi:molybdopterin converting factor small subunit